MRKRMILTLVAVTGFLAIIGFVKFQLIQAAMAQASSFQPPPEAVTTILAGRESWEQTLEAIGTVSAVHGVTVSADLPGLVDTIEFESGQPVQAGEVLVRLDTRQEQAQLRAAEARRELALLNFDRARGLREEGVVSQSDYDSALAARDQAEANVGEIRAAIERKTIRAPFSGVLGIRQVDLGQFLNGGAAIVPLQSLDRIYVDFAVPQQELEQVSAGGKARVTTDGVPGAVFPGTITAIDSIVDPATRNAQIRATLDNPGHRLRPGMFVKAQVVLPARMSVVALPASAIRYAPYGDSVFIVEDVKGPKGEAYRGVRQQVVKVGSARGDQVAVLSGVSPGEEVVTSGVFKLRNGAAVFVNNEVRPGNNPAPRPEDS